MADLLSLQNAVLEAVATGRDLFDTLALLCHEVEQFADDVACSVLLLERGRLWHAAAPSLPQGFIDAIDGSLVGPAAGSCGTAAFLGKPVEVSDIERDPLWLDYRAFAIPHGLRACWSSPIFSREGAILGTFALYFKQARGPSDLHREAVKVSTPLAAIAIERHRMDTAERARIAELAASNARFEQLNHTLELRVAERTSDLNHRNAELAHAFDELQRTHAQLFEAKRLVSLSHLVVGVAHELNTPIGNARVLSTTLAERCNAFRKSSVGAIKRSDMTSFLDEVAEGCEILSHSLEVAADRVGRFKSLAMDHSASPRRAFILREEIDDVIALFEPALRDHHCELEVEVPGDIVLESYPGPLAQVLSNILDNALEHGLNGRLHGRIRISVNALPAAVEIRVDDNGKGIDADIVDHVFDPFFTTRLADGYSGLGLHVAHSIVHGLLGGSITLDRSVAEGTCVSVRIPAAAPQAQAEPEVGLR